MAIEDGLHHVLTGGDRAGDGLAVNLGTGLELQGNRPSGGIGRGGQGHTYIVLSGGNRSAA